MKFKVIFCSALAVAAGLPLAAVLGILPGIQDELRLTASRMERGLALLFACAALAWAAWSRYLNRRAARETSSGASENTPDFAPGLIPPGAPGSVSWAQVLAAALPGLPLIVYTLVFTLKAHDALFLVDLDFTGISSAMNNTAKGHGLLTTPFFHTGTGGGYLGHHFSPTLLAFVPYYFLADLFSGVFAGGARTTHLIYGILLWAVLTLGIIAWARLLTERLGDAVLAGAILAAFMLAYPLHRLVLSFHYELPAFACSALVFIGLRENRRLLLWLGLAGWMGVKEDASLYVLLFALALLTVRAHRPIALRMAIFSLAWFLAANLILRPYFAGGDGPVWNYWKGGPMEGAMNLVTAPGALQSPGVLLAGLFGQVPEVLSRLPLGSLFDLLLAFAFLPLLSGRLALFTLPLIFAVHLVSGHRWHATFYGHYSYSVLPFLMLGALHGFTILAGWIHRIRGGEGPTLGMTRALALGVLAVTAYSAAGDKETPLPASPPDPRTKIVSRILGDLPRRACVRTQTFFTAHAPLDVYVFPLEIPRGNPMRDRLPPHAAYTAGVNGAPACREFYILLDEENFTPYYTRLYMERFRARIEEGLRKGELERLPGDRAPIKAARAPGSVNTGVIRLYRARSTPPAKLNSAKN